MKSYIRPSFSFIELKTEERLAGSVCTGSCSVEVDGYTLENGVMVLKHFKGQC